MYENFVLELDYVHLRPGGNSGLFIWSDAITAVGQPFTRAIEVQVLDGQNTENYTSHGDVFSIHGAKMTPDRPHPAGWERCLPSEHRTKPAGEWNHYRVECNDGSLKLSVNGKEVSGGHDIRPRKGYICLESEGGLIHFKDIRIKELPSTHPKSADLAKEDEGFKSIYTGVDLAGWRATDGQQGHWQPKDWILAYDGKGDAKDKPLWTEKSYGDFVMIVDWKLPKDASGGSAGVCLRGSKEAQVKIGSPTGAQPDRAHDGWNRFTITVKGDAYTVALNGKTLTEGARLEKAEPRGPMGLVSEGPIEFGNLYVRDLGDAAGGR
jgi:hypothetical protein